MSFLEVFKKVGKGLKFAANVGSALAPAVSIFNPAAGAFIQLITARVHAAEEMFPESGAGAQKREYVVAELTNTFTLAFQLTGKQIPPDLPELIGNAADAYVALMNATAKAAKV